MEKALKPTEADSIETVDTRRANPWIPSTGRDFAGSIIKKAKDITDSNRRPLNFRGFEDAAPITDVPAIGSNTPILDDIARGVPIDEIPELDSIKGKSPKGFDVLDKSVITGKSTLDMALDDLIPGIDLSFKDVIKKFGLWIVAILFILLGVWQLSKS